MIPHDAQISISNIAWPGDADDEALKLVHELGFRGVELAPGKVFSHRDAVDEARKYRKYVEGRGLEVVAFQALLFGDYDFALFSMESQRQALADQLGAIARLAGIVGAKACVFGAPKARVRNGLDESKAFEEAVTFFDALGEVYEGEGVALAIEANAAHYGCDFLTHTEQALALVKAIGRPGIRLQLDTGTLLLNSESASVISHAVPWTAHFHASEPDLVPLENPRHAQFGEHLGSAGYEGWRSVEMRATEDWQASIRTAAGVMATHYA